MDELTEKIQSKHTKFDVQAPRRALDSHFEVAGLAHPRDTASIRQYFAVICKAFDSFYNECVGVFKKPPLSLFFFFPSNLFITRALAGSAMECRALFCNSKDARNVGPGVEEFQCSVMIVLAHGVLSSHSNPSTGSLLWLFTCLCMFINWPRPLQINAPFDFRLHKNERV